MEAMLNDEEVVKGIVLEEMRTGRKSEDGIRVAEYDVTAELLSRLITEVRSNTAATIAAAGGKPRTPEPGPRPITILPRIRHAMRKRQHESLAARVLRRPTVE